MRFGSARSDTWGAAIAVESAGDGVNIGAATCAARSLPAPIAPGRGRRSCQCSGAEPVRSARRPPRPRGDACAPPRVPRSPVCAGSGVHEAASRVLGVDVAAAAAAAADAACGCDSVVYTAAAFDAGYEPVALRFKTPPTYATGTNGSWCLVAIGNSATAAAFARAPGGWRVAAAGDRSGRKAAKVAKILAHYFFPDAARTLFVDHKLTLAAHPLELLDRLLRAADVGGFAHPCAAGPRPRGCPPGSGDWLEAEVAAVLASNRTGTPAALLAQVARYASLPRGLYLDAAVLARTRAAAPLECAWANEFLRVDSGDRDQPALAIALGASPDARAYTSSGVPPPACKPLCHWSFSPTDVAAKTGKAAGDRRFTRAQSEGLLWDDPP